MKIYKVVENFKFRRSYHRYVCLRNDLVLSLAGGYSIYRKSDDGYYYYFFGIASHHVPARFRGLLELVFNSEAGTRPVDIAMASAVKLLKKKKKVVSNTLLKEIAEVASA